MKFEVNFKTIGSAYSGKIIKIYQRYGLLARDSLGLGEPYSMKKIVLSLKDINTI